MATNRPEAAPFLAQVPVVDLVPQLSAGRNDGSAGRTEVRRRAGLSRVGKRSVGLLFLGLGIISMLALGRGAAAAVSDGLHGDDAVLLAMLGIISLVVASQAVSLLRTMPGIRRIWRWAARGRQRRAGPTPRRPLLAQADAPALLPQMSPIRGGTGSRLRPAAATASWVALTLVIMAAAMAGAGLVARSATRSVDSHGWGLDTLLRLGLAVLIGYGVTLLSIGLIRSWFERRRRRLRRLLMRLLRYLLRGFDRSAAGLRRMLGRFDGHTGLAGRAVLATGGMVVVVVASLGIPVSAVGGTTTNAAGPGSTSTSTTVVNAVSVDQENTPGISTAESSSEEGGAEAALSDPAPAVTAATTTIATTTTTTATTAATTTTTAATTTTTVAPLDTTGPTVSGVSDGPDPIFTSGTAPDTSQVSATASDPSGVANMTVYYRLGGGAFAVWTSIKGGSVSTTFGPFGVLGIYEYRIMATDTFGNANCKTPAGCPGGTVTVVIP